MKKNIAAAIIAAMTLTASAMPALAQTGRISEAQAKQIALQNAGLKESEVTFVKCGLDMDDGRMVVSVFPSGDDLTIDDIAHMLSTMTF